MKYVGTLAKPIVLKHLGLLADDAAFQAEAERTTSEIFAKLPDLFKAHGVLENDFFGLALALAKNHVPGFKLAKPAGRPTEWSLLDKAEFRVDVDTFIKNNGVSVVEAIKLTIRLDRWAEKTQPMKLAALEWHYYDADLRFVAIVKHAHAFDALPVGVRVRAMNQLSDPID